MKESVEAVRCPGCGHPMQRVVDGGVRYACDACRGHLVGLAPFERAHPADGRRLWVATEGGEACGGACPFCGGALVLPAVAGAPDGLAVCRRCEQVWVPSAAEEQLGGTAPAPTDAVPERPAHPDQCPGCGAPWAPDAGGRCHYCHEQLAADQPVLIIEGLRDSW